MSLHFLYLNEDENAAAADELFEISTYAPSSNRIISVRLVCDSVTWTWKSGFKLEISVIYFISKAPPIFVLEWEARQT